jgi:hypothetical protein
MMRCRMTLVAAVALLLTSCGNSSTESAQSTDSVVAPSGNGNEASGGLTGIQSVTLEGATFSLDEALEEKPVVLWFWAPG